MSLLAAAVSAAVDSTAVSSAVECVSANRIVEFGAIGYGCINNEAIDTVPAADAMVGSGSVMMDVEESFISIGRSPSMALALYAFVVVVSIVALIVLL